MRLIGENSATKIDRLSFQYVMKKMASLTRTPRQFFAADARSVSNQLYSLKPKFCLFLGQSPEIELKSYPVKFSHSRSAKNRLFLAFAADARAGPF